MNDTSITLWNTAMPLLVLIAVCAVLPWIIVPGETRSQKRVVQGVVITAVIMILLSGLVMWAFDQRVLDAGDSVAGRGVLIWMYTKSALGAVLAWGPILLLVWLSLAQRVERRKGEDMLRGEGT